jgi:CheY-like chemotaxis protein
MNLTSNAIKFTDKNKSICMSTYIENNKLIISVEDEGIGVEKENQERIFSIFEQEDNSIRRKFGGTGLGLALLKSVVEEMQGSIDLESKVGHGSTFIITLPYFPKKRGDSEQSFLLGTPAKGINILVIEDNVLNQDILKNVLLKFSANVEIANNGNEGLQMLNEQTDIIFSDLHMPECDGYQFLEKIKPFKEKYHDIPIYIFTADIQEEIKQKCLNLGAKGFFKKPLSLSSIKGILIEEFPQDKTKHQSNDMINLKEVNEKLSECMIKLKSIDFLEKEIMGDAISLALDIAVEYNLIDLIDELESLEEISLGDKQDTYFIKIEYIENIIKKSN